MTDEMIKLRKSLDERDIKWIDHSDPDDYKIHIDRTHFTVGHHFISVIHGFGTYGGVSLYGKDKGLLEMQLDHLDPVGFYTAEDIIKKVDELIRGEQ